MKKKLIYRGPEPSHATRPISRRSKASLRGALVAKLPGFGRPRVIQFESALEYAFLCLTLVRTDIHHIWEQPTAVPYIGDDGHPAKHVFDFLLTKACGERIAVPAATRYFDGVIFDQVAETSLLHCAERQQSGRTDAA